MLFNLVEATPRFYSEMKRTINVLVRIVILIKELADLLCDLEDAPLPPTPHYRLTPYLECEHNSPSRVQPCNPVEELIRRKRIYFSKRFCYWFASNLHDLNRTNTD